MNTMQMWLPRHYEAGQQTSIDEEEAYEVPSLAEQLIAAGGKGVRSIFLGEVRLLLGCPCLVADLNPWVFEEQ